MRQPSPRNCATQLVNEYMEAIGMNRKDFAFRRCRMSLSWLHKVLSGERPFTRQAAEVFEKASRGTLRADVLMELVKEPAKQ